MSRLDAPRFYAVPVFLFLLNRVLETQGWSAEFLRSWLDDVLVLPLALGLALWLHRRGGRPPSWTIPGFQVILSVILYAVVFELVLPARLGGATADFWDLPAYAAGGSLFHFVLNRPAAPRPTEEPT